MGRTQIAVAGTGTTGSAAATSVTADPTSGNSVANPDGNTTLIVTNTGGVTRTLRVQLAADVDGQQVTPRAYPIPAGQTRYVGPFPRGWYGDQLLLNPEHTDLTIGAVSTGPPVAAVSTAGRVPFWRIGPVLAADDTYPGIDVSGSVLLVDTALTPVVAAGGVLAVTA